MKTKTEAVVKWFQPIMLACVLVTMTTNARAVGFRLPNQDPVGIARGNAFVATADNPSAIYYNPAGITQLEGDQFRAGMYLISSDTKFTSSLGLGSAHTDSSFQPVPQLYYSHAFKNTPFTAGLGIYAPFGLGIDWGNNAPFDPMARKGKLLYATVNPVIAWRALPSLSLAIGPNLNYANADLQSGMFKFKGDAISAAFTAGVLWQPHTQWSFGLKYQSWSDLDLEGHSELPAVPLPTKVDTTASAHIPQSVTFGVSYRPTTNWNFEVDLDWTDWDSLNTVNFERNDPVFAPVVPFPFNYRSSWMYEVGVTRQLGNGWSVSAGYIYSENSIPDANFNPLIPDSNLHLGSVGVGHKGKTWDWDLGYTLAYNDKREVTGAVVPLANGTYRTLNHAINLSVTYKF